MDILRSDGKLAAGVMGLYQLPNGAMFFCECAEEKDGKFIFPAEKTANLIVQPGPKNVNYKIVRADKFFGSPERLRVSTMGVIYGEITDASLVRNARLEISGLIIDPRKMN